MASPHPPDIERELTFDIFFRGNKTGEVHAQKTEARDYQITSRVQINIIKTFKIDFSLHNSYNDKGLDNATLKNSVNSSLRDYSNIVWKGNHYQVIKPKDTFKLHKDQILYSTACLYFEEPKGKSQVFSENYLDYIPIEKVGTKRYELYLPSGNSNTYIYNDKNELEKAIIRDALVQFQFSQQ